MVLVIHILILTSVFADLVRHKQLNEVGQVTIIVTLLKSV